MALPRTLAGIMADSGDTSAFLNIGQRQSQNISQSVPNSSSIARFNEAVMNLLFSYQQKGLGTSQFVQQGLNAQEAQANRILQPASSQFIGASPDIQSGVRSASAEALQPTIQGAQKSQQTFTEQLKGFENILKTAKEYGVELAKISPTPEIINGYTQMIRSGGNPASIPEEVRGKVLSEAAKDPTIWDDWQEANRKGQQDQLSLYQQEQLNQRKDSNFLTLQNRFQASPLVKAAQRAKSTSYLIPTLEKNPGSRENQLIALYQFIQILDNYMSTVREGEISLATGASSLQERVQTAWDKLQKGQVNNPQVTLDIVKGMKTLISSINSAAQDMELEYAATANTAGIGDLWSNYRGQLNQQQPVQQNQTEDEWEYIPQSSSSPRQMFTGLGLGTPSTPRF